MYNLTAVQNATDLAQFFVAINNLGDGLFMAFSLILIFVITFIGFRRDDNLTAMLYASYMTSVTAIFLVIVGFIGIFTMIIPIVIMGILIFMKVISSDN